MTFTLNNMNFGEFTKQFRRTETNGFNAIEERVRVIQPVHDENAINVQLNPGWCFNAVSGRHTLNFPVFQPHIEQLVKEITTQCNCKECSQYMVHRKLQQQCED